MIELILHNSYDEEVHINFDDMESWGVITERSYNMENKDYIGMTYIVPKGMLETNSPYIVKESPNAISKAIVVQRYTEILLSTDKGLAAEALQKAIDYDSSATE